MTNLDKLLNIAQSATPGPWNIKKPDGDNEYGSIITPDWGEILYSTGQIFEDHNLEYLRTFSPNLLKAMLAEIKAGREMREGSGFSCEYTEAQRDAFDKARDRLDEMGNLI